VGISSGSSARYSRARKMGMSEDHLLKVVQRLSQLGYVKTIRGRNGGMKLAVKPETIVVGQVVRRTEDNMALVPCFDPTEVTCPIAAACGLAPALDEALQAFLTTLDRYTVADLIATRREALHHLLGAPPEVAVGAVSEPAA
jgi:Rrf2 family transcriptional regulator, nitric oxide-sensitive transcriptional repressor